MQPDNTSPTNTPQNQPNQFDFILKDKPKPKKSLVPSFTNLPRVPKLAAGIGLAVIVLIVLFFLLLGGRSAGSDKMVGAIAQAQEIVRVDAVATQQAKTATSATQNLIATSSAVLSSQQTELTQYLKTNKVKISKTKLNASLNKNTDTQLKAAAQNNNLDSVYLSYLKNQLNGYQTTLQVAHKSAGKSGKAILSKDFDSIQTLLKTPQLASSSN